MNITIIGLGVIGGSLGLAVKQNMPRAVVTGYDARPELNAALRRSAVDFGARSLSGAVRDADIIFLCTPTRTIPALLPDVARFCKKNAIVTDVGSTKSAIVTAAKKFFRTNGIFVGGHPMAGSEGKGIGFADPLMFQNATYVLCPDGKSRRTIAPLTTLLRSIGARVLFLPSTEHDTIAAAISHLPQLVAVGMMNMATEKNKRHPGYLQLAAGGFRDITRIASSPYGMWKDILAGNAREISRSAAEFSALLARFARDVKDPARRHRFESRFRSAKATRDAIPKNSKGFLHPLHDIIVAVEDVPGVLSQLTTVLFKAKINIKDIELLKIRDGRGGTFRLSFDTASDAEQAVSVLKRKKFKAHALHRS